MKKQLYFALAMALGLMALTFYGERLAQADHDQKVAIDRGTYARMRTVTPTATTGTAIWPGADGDQKIMDSVCVNNSANTVWIGTATDTVSSGNAPHPNAFYGIPITSTQSFRLGGVFSGVMTGTCDSAKVCEIRCIDQLNR